MSLIFADTEGQKIFKVTNTYQQHIARGSVAPGEDWGTGDGTGMFSIRSGGIINNWIGDRGICITSITYNDLGFRFQFEHVDPQFVNPSGKHLNAGELICRTGHSGRQPSGIPYDPHVHIDKFIGAHITEDGRIDKPGKRVDPVTSTQDQSLVTKPMTTTVTVPQVDMELNKITELQRQLIQQQTDSATILTSTTQEKQALIDQKQTEIDSLKGEIDSIHKSVQGVIQLDSSGIATEITSEVIKNSGLLVKWCDLVEKTFPGDDKLSEMIKQVLKYEIFVVIGMFAFAIPTQVVFWNADPSLKVGVSFAAGIIFKLLVAKYDTNKDGKLDLQDTMILKQFDTSL